MYKIIIAEDEPLALRTLKNIIDRHYPDMQVVGEARSGEEALSLIEEKCPDMVFSDIRMPVMDGIELIRQIRARNLDIELVIISGYQDFQFAQSAIRYGVVEYLLKPISLNKINTLMDKLRDTLNEKYQKKQYDCFRNLIVKNDYTVSDINRYLMNDRYYIGVIRKKGIPFRYGMQINELEINFDMNTGGHYWVLACRDESEVILIADRDIVTKMKEFTRVWCGGEYYTAVYSAKKIMLQDFADTVHNLIKEINARIIVSKTVFIEISSLEHQEDLAVVLSDTVVDQMTHYIKDYKVEELKRATIRLFSEWERNECPLIHVEKSLRTILYFASKYIHTDTLEDSMLLEEAVCYANNMGELMESFWFILHRSISQGKPETEKTGKEIFLDSIEDYLNNHINEVLSMEMVCDYFGISQTYFSRLFRTYKKTSFKEYFMKMKIDKAKEVMRAQPDLRLWEIAKLVGYEDAAYFSRVFKNITGELPSDFQRKYN